MEARYVFAVQFRLEPEDGVVVEPDTFETRLFRPADSPGTPGWRFFRDNLWRGELADAAHFRDLTEEVLSVPVDWVEFRALETDEAYLEALRSAIREDLPSFKAESVSAVLNKYLGSRLEVK
ncbi:MAG: LWR-salt protein [Halodesulfurarchaeum sp.]